VLLALAAPACGPAEDEITGPEVAVKATVERLYDAIRIDNSEAACETMTEEVQAEVTAGALGTGKGGTCVDAFQRFLDAVERQGQLPLMLRARLESVDVTGTTAMAGVRFDEDRVGAIPLAKENGEWKVDRARAVAPLSR
jgi:hypothetical protein